MNIFGQAAEPLSLASLISGKEKLIAPTRKKEDTVRMRGEVVFWMLPWGVKASNSAALLSLGD